MIRAACIKSNVPIRTNTAQEKSDTSLLSDFIFILIAPLVYFENRFFLELLLFCLHFAIAQREINVIVGKYFQKMFSFSQFNFIRIYQLSLFNIKTKVFNIIFQHKII